MSEPRLRQDLATFSRRVWERGWVANHDGNLSVRSLVGLAGALETTPAALLCGPDATVPTPLPVVALLGLRGAGKTTIGRSPGSRRDGS